MSDTSGNRVRWAKAEYPHRERVPRWRWMPAWWRWWPQRDSYWTSMRFEDGGVGFVITDSEDELHTRMAEQIRFYHDEDENCSVAWTWLRAHAHPGGTGTMSDKIKELDVVRMSGTVVHMLGGEYACVELSDGTGKGHLVDVPLRFCERTWEFKGEPRDA